MTTPDIADLCEWLRWYRSNPYGRAAADTLERQAAEIERLREALRPFVAVLEHDISADADGTDWFTPMKSNNRAPRLIVSDFRAARAALTGEDA
jgi:hypothetical protein